MNEGSFTQLKAISVRSKDRQVSEEKARYIFFLARWRGQLLIDETEDDSDAIELDRRVLDYYLDQYNELATFVRRSLATAKSKSSAGGHSHPVTSC